MVCYSVFVGLWLVGKKEKTMNKSVSNFILTKSCPRVCRFVYNFFCVMYECIKFCTNISNMYPNIFGVAATNVTLVAIQSLPVAILVVKKVTALPLSVKCIKNSGATATAK